MGIREFGRGGLEAVIGHVGLEFRHAFGAHRVDFRERRVEPAGRFEGGDIGAGIPAIVLRPWRLGIGAFEIVALGVSRKVAQQPLRVLGRKARFERLGGLPARAIHHRHPRRLVILQRLGEQGTDRERHGED